MVLQKSSNANGITQKYFLSPVFNFNGFSLSSTKKALRVKREGILAGRN